MNGLLLLTGPLASVLAYLAARRALVVPDRCHRCNDRLTLGRWLLHLFSLPGDARCEWCAWQDGFAADLQAEDVLLKAVQRARIADKEGGVLRQLVLTALCEERRRQEESRRKGNKAA